MALKAGNEVVGGNTLRRAAIQSPNFVTGVSGWSINQDGSAEFNNVVIRGGQIVSGTALFYSGPPARGNLVASISAASGTDSHGNAYLQGVWSYFPDPVLLNFATGLVNNEVQFATAPAGSNGGGPWAVQGNINLDSTGLILELTGTSGIEALQHLKADTGLTVVNGETVDTLTVTAGETANAIAISAATNAGGLLTITNTIATGAANILEILTAVTDRAYGVRLAADTNNRMSWNAGGQFNWGSGAANADASLYRGAVAQLAAAYIAFDNAGTPETWQVPVFANGWLNSGGGPNLQYRRVAAPYKSVQWVGQLTAPAGLAAGQAVITAAPAAYRPTNNQSVLGVDLTTGALVRFQYGSGGILRYESGSAVGDAIDITGGALIPLDA